MITFGITNDDIEDVFSAHGAKKSFEELNAISKLLDHEKISDAAQQANECGEDDDGEDLLDNQTKCALEQIEVQLLSQGIISGPPKFKLS